MNHALRALLLLAWLLPLGGCAFVKLPAQAREFYSATVLVGRVSAPSGWHGSVAGYEPHVSRHVVVPGQAVAAAPLVLRPQR